MNESDRFWSKVRPDPDGCWLWTACTNQSGYGAFHIGKWSDVILAHRYSWQCYYGPIEDGMNVLHKCDTPACVRPDHLFIGTKAENSADMVAKGRSSIGSRNGSAKLEDGEVLFMRAIYDAGGAGVTEISRAFGISHATGSHILSRKLWTHLP